MKDDLRVTLTKRLLQDGLLRLLKQKELSKINVTELCEEAGVNRATFYRHYEQPRDILNELRKNVSQDVTKIAMQCNFENGLKQWLEATCYYFYEHSEVLNILFRSRTDDEFVTLLNDLYNEHFSEFKKIGYNAGFDNDSMRLGTYYFAGGIYYILRQWLMEPIDKSPKEIAELILRLLNI